MVSLLVSVIAIVIVYFILDIRHVLCFPKRLHDGRISEHLFICLSTRPTSDAEGLNPNVVMVTRLNVELARVRLLSWHGR